MTIPCRRRKQRSGGKSRDTAPGFAFDLGAVADTDHFQLPVVSLRHAQSTMLAISARVRPCSARCFLRSVGRVTDTSAPLDRDVISGWIACSSVPLGPVTLMSAPARSTLTLSGTARVVYLCETCRFLLYQQRSMISPPIPFSAASKVGHDAAGRGDDRDPLRPPRRQADFSASKYRAVRGWTCAASP